MIQGWEILTLAFLALLIFGPERLPGMARTAGRTIAKLRREATSTLDEIKQATEYEELRKSANLSELRELSNDLRNEAAAITREADQISGQASLVAGASAAAADDVASDAPAPFDPDAT